MRRISGMTLIELMMVMAVVALLVAIALPSYQRYLARGIRSQAQQFMMDMAQAQEQFFLDQRQYASTFGTAPGQLNRSIPPSITAQYTMGSVGAEFTVNNLATPPTFMIVLRPNAGGTMVSDGVLILNNLQQRWRESVASNNLINDGPPQDCTWEAGNCVPQ